MECTSTISYFRVELEKRKPLQRGTINGYCYITYIGVSTDKNVESSYIAEKVLAAWDKYCKGNHLHDIISIVSFQQVDELKYPEHLFGKRIDFKFEDDPIFYD